MEPAQTQPAIPPNDIGNQQNPQSEEYYASLRNWLNAVESWSNLVVAYQVLIRSELCVLRAHSYGFNPTMGNPGLGSGVLPPFAPFTNPPTPHSIPVIRPMPRGIDPPPSVPSQPHIHLNLRARYKIAPVWRRFVAEFIDFLFLFCLKVFASFIAIDFFDFINLDRMDLDFKALNYKSFMELTAEIVVLELIHRVVVCIYETYWLKGPSLPGRPGGATPGKVFMNLCVVSCDEVIIITGRPESVFIKPGNELGLARSFARAFLKNFILSILFPVCAFLVFFKHNQTAYDVVSKSIVIEVNEVPARQRPL